MILLHILDGYIVTASFIPNNIIKKSYCHKRLYYMLEELSICGDFVSRPGTEDDFDLLIGNMNEETCHQYMEIDPSFVMDNVYPKENPYKEV